MHQNGGTRPLIYRTNVSTGMGQHQHPVTPAHPDPVRLGVPPAVGAQQLLPSHAGSGQAPLPHQSSSPQGQQHFQDASAKLQVADQAAGPRPSPIDTDLPPNSWNYAATCLPADNARKADALTQRIDDALFRITSQVSDAISQLGTELPQLWHEHSERKRALDACSARMESVEKLLSDEMTMRRELERSLRSDADRLSQSQANCQARVEVLEDDLQDEARQRQVMADMLQENHRNGFKKSSEMFSELEASLHSRLEGEAECRESLERQLGVQRVDREKGIELQALLSSRVLLLEQNLSQETQARYDLEASLTTKADAERLEVMLRTSISRVDVLEKSLTEEADTRYEADKTMNKDLCEQIDSEIERLNETVLREMRERMDGQKTMREEVQVQQQCLMRLTPRVDEAFIELQTELPRLREELRLQKTLWDKFAEEFGETVLRMEKVETDLSEEVNTRRDAGRALSHEVREQFRAEASRMDSQVSLVQKLQEEFRSYAESTRLDVRAAREMVEHLADDVGQAGDTVDRLGGQVRSAQEQRVLQTADVEKRLGTMQSWLESAVVSRINEIDLALRREMTERSSVTKQVLDAGAHNSERWCQMQSKVDALLLDVQRLASWRGDRGVPEALSATTLT